MAHMQKYKLQQVVPMLAHYERTAEIERGYQRVNIDPERTHLNYNLIDGKNAGQCVKNAIAEHEKNAGKGIRKDANVLVDWVITLPQDCPQEQQRNFFVACVDFCKGRYGIDNIIGAYVHLDETTPHIHIPVLPVQSGKLQASKVINRADLQTFHTDLNRYVDNKLGIHVSIELDEQEKGTKQLSRLSQTEYIASQKRLESLRQDIESTKSAAEPITTSAKTLVKARNDGEREKQLRERIEQLRERIADVRERIQIVRERTEQLRERIKPTRERLELVREQVKQVLEHFSDVPNTLNRATLQIAKNCGKPIFDPYSLDYRAELARQVAKSQIKVHNKSDLER